MVEPGPRGRRARPVLPRARPAWQPPFRAAARRRPERAASTRRARRADPVFTGRFLDFRLLPAAAAVWVGVLAGAAAQYWLLAALGGAAACGYLKARRTLPRAAARRAVSVVVLAGLALGAGTAAGVGLTRSQRQAQERIAAAALPAGGQGSPAVHLQLRVDGVPRPLETGRSEPRQSERYFAPARVLAVRVAGEWRPVGGELMLSGAGLDAVARGQTIIGFGTLDEEDRRLSSLGWFRLRRYEVADAGSPWSRTADKTRAGLESATAGLQPDLRGLIGGMAIGDDRLVSPELRQAMLTTSLLHLVAVSGSHIAVTLAAINAVVPGIRWVRPALTGLFLLFLLVVVGPEPAVLRASAMAAVLVAGTLLHRSRQTLSALSVVVIVALLVSPRLAASIGFALSVVVTWGIIFSLRVWRKPDSAPPTARVLRAVISLPGPFSGAAPGGTPALGRTRKAAAAPSWLTRATTALRTGVLVALAANLWAFPLTLLLNPWLPLYAVPANVVAAPAVAPLTVLGLLATAVAPLHLPTAQLLAQAAAPFAWWIERVATSLSGAPWARAPWPPGGVGIAAAVAVLALVMALSARKAASSSTDTNGDTDGKEVGRHRAGAGASGAHRPGTGFGDGTRRPVRGAGQGARAP